MSFGKQARTYKAPEGIKYAGTTDLVCEYNKSIYIIDFKTGTKPKEVNGYPEWALQTAAYRNAYQSPSVGNAVVHLNKESGEMNFFDYSSSYSQDLEAFSFLCEYWRNRNPEIKGVPSVTTITGILDKSGPLIWWAVNSMREYLFEALNQIGEKEIGVIHIEREHLYSIIESARKEFRSVSKKAMDIGTQVHEAIEQWFKTGMEPSKKVSDAVLAGFVAFLDWTEKNEIKPIATEIVVYGKY